METTSRSSAQAATEQDYYSVLAGVLASTSQDHAQLRALIFDLARIKLRKDLMQRFPEVGAAAMQQQLRALDAAIERIEADFAVLALPSPSSSHLAGDDAVLDLSDRSPPTLLAAPQLPATFSDGDAPISYPFGLPVIRARARAASTVTITEQGDRWAPVTASARFRAAFWSTLQMTIAAALGAAIYVAIDAEWLTKHREGPRNAVEQHAIETDAAKRQASEHATERSDSRSRPAIPGLPLPSAYGVYAISDGRLVDLDLLPFSVPDPRVALSTVISKPGRVHLPTGHLQFVVFRRDLLNNAPDKVMARVVARVVRALTFGATGKAKISPVDDAWIIRSNSYQMSVAPIPDNPEMVLIRPMQLEFAFPAGRYALALKNLGYDFTVDGAMTDLSHCLERTDALNTTVYSECHDLGDVARKK